jgi:hypothetical protein
MLISATTLELATQYGRVGKFSVRSAMMLERLLVAQVSLNGRNTKKYYS